MKELYKYQELDIELKRLEKKLNNNEYVKKVNFSKETAKNCQIRMLEINNESKKLLEEIDKITTVKTKGIELVKKYTETDLSSLDEKSVLEIVNKIKPIKKNIEELISRLTILENRMNSILEEFDNLKKQILSSKKIFEENKVMIDKLKTELEPKIESIKKSLAIQEKNIKPELFQKYRNLKREGIFPVLVKLTDGKNCGYCRLEQSIHKLDKIKINGYTECEQCHRVILNEI